MRHMDWTPPRPPLRAGGIGLRVFRADDATSVVEAGRDAAIVRFTFMRDGLTLGDAEQWIEQANAGWARGTPRFAIVGSASDRVLGQIGMAVDDAELSAEVFYWVAAPARGRGVASTALALVCDWAFDAGMERLFLVVHPENDASHRVAARCGFSREGVLRGYERFKGTRPDVVSWSLLPRDPRPWRNR